MDGSTGFKSGAFGTDGRKGAKRKTWSQLGPPFSAVVSAIAGVAPQTLVTLGAKGGVLGWYTANTLQGHGQSTHYIPVWALGVHS